MQSLVWSLFLSSLVACAAARPSLAGWDLSGEAGASLDSVGEEFGSGASFDDQIDPGSPLEDVSAALRFKDRTTEPSGVFALRLRETGRRFEGGLRIKSRPDASRGEADFRLRLPSAAGIWRWDDRLYSEFAGSEADGGWLHGAELGWRGPRRILGAELDLRLAHEFSRAGSDTFASLFDYQLVRPAIELSRRAGAWHLSLDGGTQHRRVAEGGDGDYDGSWAGFTVYGGGAAFDLRTESRDYSATDSLTPSYQEISLDAGLFRRFGGSHEARLEAGARALQYALDSAVFRDHTEWDVGLHWKMEFGGPNAGSAFRAAGGAADTSSPLARLDAALAELALLEAAFDAEAAGDDEARPVGEAAADGGSPFDDPIPLGSESPLDARDPAESKAPSHGETRVDAGVAATDPDAARGRRVPEPAWGRWYLGLGVLGAGSVGEREDSGDYAESSGRVSFGREGDRRFWLDLSLELGRRDYVRPAGGGGLAFEGYDFSLSGSDYSFWQGSLIGELDLPASFALEVFAQYEDQKHDEPADDFRLWLLTVSLLRRF